MAPCVCWVGEAGGREVLSTCRLLPLWHSACAPSHLRCCSHEPCATPLLTVVLRPVTRCPALTTTLPRCLPLLAHTHASHIHTHTPQYLAWKTLVQPRLQQEEDKQVSGDDVRRSGCVLGGGKQTGRCFFFWVVAVSWVGSTACVLRYHRFHFSSASLLRGVIHPSAVAIAPHLTPLP